MYPKLDKLSATHFAAVMLAIFRGSPVSSVSTPLLPRVHDDAPDARAAKMRSRLGRPLALEMAYRRHSDAIDVRDVPLARYWSRVVEILAEPHA